MSRKTKMCLIALLVFLASMGSKVNADFTFGTPTNLGLTVNSSAEEAEPSISADGLSLFFSSNRPGGSGNWDIWVATRVTTDGNWGVPVNLGPTVNSSAHDLQVTISADGLELYFASKRSDGFGTYDAWVTRRAAEGDDWAPPVNLGSPINTSSKDFATISADGLELYITSNCPGSFGSTDLWVSTRATTENDWGTPLNLGTTVNSPYSEGRPKISADGLMLFFSDGTTDQRPDGFGNSDIWMTMRKKRDAEWSEPVNLGPAVNTPYIDRGASPSADGSTLYFCSNRPSGKGEFLDLWQVSIDPVVDLNVDGIVDSADMCIIVDNWGTNEPLCDIGPMPWGDGIVDVQDLIVAAEHLFEEIPPIE
jgi:Tol biopolymer transport system component